MDEFKEYGDLDMMIQYVKDLQSVQKKLTDCSETITFINEVHKFIRASFFIVDTFSSFIVA